MTVLIF